MESFLGEAAILIAKIFIVIIFPFSALDKIINWQSALKQANSSFLPGGSVLLVLAMVVEIVTPICIVFNWYAGWAAFVLAGYCAITAVLYHNFWSYPRFWAADSEGHPHVWDFFKNFAIVGGCIFIMLGSGMVKTVETIAEPSAALRQQSARVALTLDGPASIEPVRNRTAGHLQDKGAAHGW